MDKWPTGHDTGHILHNYIEMPPNGQAQQQKQQPRINDWMPVLSSVVVQLIRWTCPGWHGLTDEPSGCRLLQTAFPISECVQLIMLLLSRHESILYCPIDARQGAFECHLLLAMSCFVWNAITHSIYLGSFLGHCSGVRWPPCAHVLVPQCDTQFQGGINLHIYLQHSD